MMAKFICKYNVPLKKQKMKMRGSKFGECIHGRVGPYCIGFPHCSRGYIIETPREEWRFFIDEIRMRNPSSVCLEKTNCHIWTNGPLYLLFRFVKKHLGSDALEWFDSSPGKEHFDLSGMEAVKCIENGAIQKFNCIEG